MKTPEVIGLQSSETIFNYQSKMQLVQSEDNKEKRANWNNRVEFLLACVGYSVGLGNIWRFGYLSAKSGGGTFSIN